MQTRPPPCAAPTAARLRALFAGRRRLEGPPGDGPGPAGCSAIMAVCLLWTDWGGALDVWRRRLLAPLPRSGSRPATRGASGVQGVRGHGL